MSHSFSHPTSHQCVPDTQNPRKQSLFCTLYTGKTGKVSHSSPHTEPQCANYQVLGGEEAGNCSGLLDKTRGRDCIQGQAEGPTPVIIHSVLTSCQQLAASQSIVMPLHGFWRGTQSWHLPPEVTLHLLQLLSPAVLPSTGISFFPPAEAPGTGFLPSLPRCLGHRYLPHLASNKRPQICTIDTRARMGGNFILADGLWTSFLLVWGTWGVLFKVRPLTLPMWACKGSFYSYPTVDLLWTFLIFHPFQDCLGSFPLEQSCLIGNLGKRRKAPFNPFQAATGGRKGCLCLHMGDELLK